MKQVPETVPAPIPTIFDVFINHRGPDVKNTIASLIYHRLKNSGYKVFLDKNELNPGDDISPAIQDAIESASVHVAIFSERYAKSTWCLEELHLMLKSFKEKRSSIIPIFADVQPHDLRRIDRGCYAKFFKKHELNDRISQEDLKKWKTALHEASLISGFLFKTKESDYGDFLDEVAKTVLRLTSLANISKSEPLEAHLAINSESFSHSVGQEIATFLASCGILSKAWEESCLAINSESYSLNEYEGVAYVGFPSFHEIEGFIVKESKYGECNIQTDNKVFSGCLKGNDDQPAFVHQGALKLLLHIMENTDFQAKLQIYTDSKQKKLKPIIFVGHFLGGVVATLATLWVLQKRLRQSSPFCVTFGCPLVGDVRLVEAVGRENWAGNFCHVVSKNDIVPRMLLAPFESTAEPLNALLPYWRGKISNARNDEPDSFIRDAYRALLQSVRQLDTSPYRPFGTYMFCSSHGAACIANSETVLEMLQLTMQSQETSSDKIVQDCLLEHIRYGSVLEHVIQNSICGRRIANSNSESSYERGISLELEAIGIGAQNDRARIAIQKAGDIENKHNTNVAKLGIELRQQQCTMAELEWYKECCDADANSLRVKLARFWDDIMEKWGSNELPSNFQSQIKWINAGTAYRRLVEPLDIAHYYRMCKGKGNYLSDGRPNRHKVLQKWMEEKEETGSALIKLPSLSRDSCFCAHVEEALKDFENLQRGQYGRIESLDKFEDYVTRMINEGGISPDVIKRTHAGSDSIPSSLHHLSSKSPLKVLSIKVSSSNKS